MALAWAKDAHANGPLHAAAEKALEGETVGLVGLNGKSTPGKLGIN